MEKSPNAWENIFKPKVEAPMNTNVTPFGGESADEAIVSF